MTRYDPFAYGEVRLDPNKQPSPSGDAAAAVDPEDMLFAGGESASAEPQNDGSWEMLSQENVDDLLPGASASQAEVATFGEDVLGEVGGGESAVDASDDDYAPAAPLPEPMANPAPAPEKPVSTPVAAEPAPAPTPAAREPMAQPAASPPMRTSRKPTKRSAPVQAAASPAELSRGKGRSVAAVLLPVFLCAGGGTAASWFWVMQGNPVMAAILGAGTLVGALFAWLLMRG